MNLIKSKEPVVIVGDYGYEYRDDFRLYLKAYEILQDDEILDDDKILAITRLLFFDDISDIYLAKSLVEGFFSGYAESKSSGKALFSLTQDAELIYAGFLQTYGIDLFDCELTIEKFIALLKGLPKDTRFSEIVEIRAMPMPKPSKYNEEQRCAIMKAKRSVALKGNDNIRADWQGFGQAIKSWATMGKK